MNDTAEADPQAPNDDATAVAAWRALAIKRLRPREGDILLITSPHKDKRETAGDLLEEALEDSGIRDRVLIICAPPNLSIESIAQRIAQHTAPQ